MKKTFQFLIAVLMVGVILAGCASTPEAVPVAEESAPEAEVVEAAPEEESEEAAEVEEEPAALLAGEAAFSRAQLEGMETLEVEYTGKDGEVTVYTGVLVVDLLAEAGLTGDTVVIVASDGYEAEVAFADLQACADCVVAFDDDELRMVLPGLPSSAQVKGVVAIQMTGEAVIEEETALLVGEKAYTMSQLEGKTTLDVEYTGKDDTVTVYTGVLLIELLAEAGLSGETVVFTASDGYEAEVSLAELEGCLDCVVAFDDGELRTVLPGLSSKAQVKGLVAVAVK